MRRILRSGCGVAAAALVALASPALAIPELQLYLEGATYDTATETWTLNDFDASTDTLRLWAIGNVGGPGNKGPISDVRLAVAYPTLDNVSITLAPSRVDTTQAPYADWRDTSTPASPTLLQTVTDGSVPKLSDGQDLPSHGEYGAETYWQEFALGNFTLTDSPIADFINAFPEVPVKNKAAQINVYEVSVAGSATLPDWLHFDLYNSVQASNKGAVFAPFSHDAGGTPGDGGGGGGGNPVPEPGTLLLLGSGLMGAAGLGRRRGKEGRKDQQIG